MKLFKTFSNDICYKDIIQLDSAFSVAHINYNESPLFNGIESKDFAKESRKHSLSSKERIEDVVECIRSFNGTEENLSNKERIILWKNYWMEYINAFDKIAESLPKSVVAIYLGRQTVEIGFKYLLLMKNEPLPKTHDLDKLSKMLFDKYEIDEEYMKWIVEFCESFSNYIEGGNAEYFRYPEYKGGSFFAGNRLDIKWLSYNFALIILKLIHFANLDTEILDDF